MKTMTRNVLANAGVQSPALQRFVAEWAALTQPQRIEVISSADDARLIAEAIESGALLTAGEGNYFARSHTKDTARSEERTVVATSRASAPGLDKTWRDADGVLAVQREKMRGALRDKTMYVVPYLMAVPNTPLANYAAGVQLTDDRSVVLHMIRMARVGIEYFADLDDPEYFVRGVHVSGKLSGLGQGTDDDQRLFATIADQRLILHY